MYFTLFYNHKLICGIVVDNLTCLCYYEIILSEMVDTVEVRVLVTQYSPPEHTVSRPRCRLTI